ncbi:TRAP transporter small permease [Xanthobacter dioxanivorans]|uniref:TRAP transporter small permease protein n=1 Tax=Xanthobacter dioxanivorans TaxID=2528964 RepID=A0A974PRV9_9HYPH|nr:TRAP transporter small permease [Xanthobacter dioxanivorans]QRG08550.1 TRAP transporter small permease [Xanthobacter dioxanivorans]
MSDAKTIDAAGRSPLGFVLCLSSTLLKVERVAVIGFMALLFGLILLNVVTRYTGTPIYWIDESAIYAVVWLAFTGASAMTRLRLDFSVGLLTERLPPRGVKVARVVATLFTVLFGVSLSYMCWIWMDPVGIAAAGFDAKEFAGQTFNFLYTEHTQTLNWPTWAVSLIMPLFAVSITLHGVANLIEDLDIVPRRVHHGFPMAHAEAAS